MYIYIHIHISISHDRNLVTWYLVIEHATRNTASAPLLTCFENRRKDTPANLRSKYTSLTPRFPSNVGWIYTNLTPELRSNASWIYTKLHPPIPVQCWLNIYKFDPPIPVQCLQADAPCSGLEVWTCIHIVYLFVTRCGHRSRNGNCALVWWCNVIAWHSQSHRTNTPLTFKYTYC